MQEFFVTVVKKASRPDEGSRLCAVRWVPDFVVLE
jgi:hypothetical protein